MFNQRVGGTFHPFLATQGPQQTSRDGRLSASEVAAQMANEPVARARGERRP